MRKIHHIPLHRLAERGKSNFEINRIEKGIIDINYTTSQDEHRDDYYIFLYQESGNSSLTVDFNDITLSGNLILCIQPGQVHFGNIASDTYAWIIAVASEWVPTDLRVLLLETTISSRPVGVNSDTEEPLFRDVFHLLQRLEVQRSVSSEQMLKSMFNVCAQLFMQVFQQAIEGQSRNNLRPELITRQFKSLLLTNSRIMKSPAEYATSLSITPAYLNEVVKETTDFPVSHWIHQEIILKAKRDLFYTEVAGISPLEFRQKYPK
jgi:AraC family transcriptional activator of pobA